MWGMAKRLPITVAWVGWSIAATLGLDGTGGDGADLWAIIISTTERSLTGGRALTMPFEYVLIRAMSVKAATDDNPSCCCCLGMVIKRWPTWTRLGGPNVGRGLSLAPGDVGGWGGEVRRVAVLPGGVSLLLQGYRVFYRKNTGF